MKWTRAITEGTANTTANPWTFGFLALLSSLLMAAPAVWEMRTTHRLYEHQQDLLDRGYYTLHISPADRDDHIDSTECRRLANIEGVVAAGGATNIPDATWWTTNGPRQNAWIVDTELIKLAVLTRPNNADRPAWQNQQILVDQAVTERITNPANNILTHDSQPVTGTIHTQRLSVLGGGFRDTAIWPTRQPSYQLCVLLIETQRRRPVSTALRGAYTNTAEVTWALPGLDSLQDPTQLYEQRSSQLGWLYGAILWTAVTLLYARLRRADSGLYLLLGATRASAALMVWTEIFLPALIGAIPTTLLLVTVATRQYPHASVAATTATLLHTTATLLAFTLLAAATVATTRTTALLRDD